MEKKDKDNIKETKASTRALVFVSLWIASLIWNILTVLMITYITGSALVLYSTQVKMEVIFSNRWRTPWFANLSDCRGFGIAKCENLFIDGSSGKLGAWFISPGTSQYIVRDAYILYLHGNTATRALDHRVQLYKKLSRMGFHMLALDYRGFGDSEGWPTEQGLVEDAKDGYRWLKKKAHGRPIYVWGHSLGSAVAVQLAAWLNSEKSQLNGVFLEAPFNNLTDAIKQNILAAPIAQILPNFDSYLEDVKTVFQSSYWIQKVTSPVVIYHDHSDHILHIDLARKLYLHAKEVGSSNVNIIEFDEKLYHNDIYAAKNLKPLINEFIRSTS